MPPKSQKMGSITHNSAEVNNREGRRGMLSKIKGSFRVNSTSSNASVSVSSKAPSKNGASSRSIKTNGVSKSINLVGPGPVTSSTAGHSHQSSARMQRRGSSSFTQGDSSGLLPHDFKEIINEDVRSQYTSGIPTSITALVDAASCLSDDMTQQQPNMLGLNLRGSTITYGASGVANSGTSNAASRALANMQGSGGGTQQESMPGGVMPRNNSGGSGSRGHNSADWARQGHNNMVQASNGGYANYQLENFEDEGVDYYDESGGGLFDDAYMQSSRSAELARQPPPRDRGKTRRSTSAEDYMPQNSRMDYRRSTIAEEDPRSRYKNRPSNAQDYMPESAYYHGSQDYVPSSAKEYVESTYNSGMNGDNAHYRGSSDGDAYNSSDAHNPSDAYNPSEHYMSKSVPPNGMEPRRNASIDNSGCGPRRRASVEYDPRKNEGRHASMGHGSSTDTRRSNTNTVVNNNGRPAPNVSSAVSHTKSPKPTMSRQGSQRMSMTAQDNPTWFNQDDEPLNSSSNSRESNHQDNQRPSSSRRDNDDDDRTMTTMATMATKAQALNPSAMNKAKDMTSPTGDVTIVYTDVQGSTSMWEACPSDMKKATDIHDTIMRQCYTNHSGYEINTEGDSFNLAFQHPVDALAFALQAQIKLHKADWPDGILKHPNGKDEKSLKFRGFRVRFGIHHGPTTSRDHEMTGRTIYSGEGVKIAKAVEGMCHGGQILTTMETWKAVSGMAERYLGRPQILDCGEHLLFETKNQNPKSNGYTTTRYTRRIMQLVPSDLAFDFFEARGRRDVPSEDGKMGFEIKDATAVNGRLFPPLTSQRQLTTCFLNAPYANGRVTICFVYTVGLDDNPDNRASNLAVMAKYLRKQLLTLNPPGYECQEDNGCWMLAFDRMAHAVTFGLQLKSTLEGAEDLVGSVDRDNMFKVGILSGPFTSMGPHKTTGMADYFGPIVNRAARVASNCEPGQVCVGIPLSNGVTADPPDFGPTVNVSLQGIKKLKGITIDVAIFACLKRRIETLY